MFYPETTLRRGGKFYLCWVADSYPSKLSRRNLWSQDVRDICDDLLEVMTRESGSPKDRFSLRLSSQLLRGLVRLYNQKVSSVLFSLCSMNASILNKINTKWEPKEKRRKVRRTNLPITYQHPDIEEHVEERLQNSNNVVARIQDITLQEEAIPPIMITTDGFGEEHPEQALDRTLELMLGVDGSLAQYSHDPLPDLNDKSRDLTRLLGPDPLMERISEHDLTLFNKSMGVGAITSDFEKEIPQFPDILPDLPAPITAVEDSEILKTGQPEKVTSSEDNAMERTMDIQLEELEEINQAERQRKKKKLIIDKKIKINIESMKRRFENNTLELRCQRSNEDRCDPRVVSVETLFRRPTHAGTTRTDCIAYGLKDLYVRNLSHRETETIMAPQSLGKRVTESISSPEILPQKRQKSVEKQIKDQPEVFDMPIQVLPTDTIEKEREAVYTPSPKKSRKESGVAAFSERKESASIDTNQQADKDKSLSRILLENVTNDENIRNLKEVSEILKSVEMADDVIRHDQTQTETPLGSLDRTKVSLGDSIQTTESVKLVNDHWGTEGTMIKIIEFIKRHHEERPVTVKELVNAGPDLPVKKRIIAVKCFTSVLKLKQHQLIDLHKDPVTLEITNIVLGEKFRKIQFSIN